jgi:hypothetical protein
MKFLPSLLTNMAMAAGRDAPAADNAAALLHFAVSEIIDVVHAFVVVDNTPEAAAIADADGHASYVSDVHARAALPDGFELAHPERRGTSFAHTIDSVSFARIPVALEKMSRGFERIGRAADRPMISMVTFILGDGTHVNASLNTSMKAHLFTAGPRPADGPTLSVSDRLEFGETSVSALPDVKARTLWTNGLTKLCRALFTTCITPENVFLATNMCNRARWRNATGDGGCPLCDKACPCVLLRLMPVSGLLVSCSNCPAETSVVVGPLYAPVFGQLTTCARAADAAPIIDPNGVSRMAPVTSYELRSDELLTLPSGRPGAGKSKTAMDEMMRALEQNREERKVYFVMVPFQLLAASHVVSFNRLFWTAASESLKDAYRRYGYISAEPTDEERDAQPFRHYETVEAADLSCDGGHVITTGNSWHRFASIVKGVDRYGRSKVGFTIIDEFESLFKLIMDPSLVNNSCIENNLVALFEALRLSKRGVPVACLDGFATDDISGRVMRAAGTPFVELRCDAGIFTGRKLTYVLDYLSISDHNNPDDSEQVPDDSSTSPKRFLLARTSVGGMIGRIIASITAGRNPQVFCSSKMQLYAIVNIVRKHFRNAPREVFVVTADTPPELRLRANAAAEGQLGEGETFGAIFSTSAVGGGLNFTITRDVFAIVYRNQANGQEVWQTYLRSRNLEHIYVCTWTSDGLWDSRLHDSFEPATDYVKWMVKVSRPRRPRAPAS